MEAWVVASLLLSGSLLVTVAVLSLCRLFRPPSWMWKLWSTPVPTPVPHPPSEIPAARLDNGHIPAARKPSIDLVGSRRCSIEMELPELLGSGRLQRAMSCDSVSSDTSVVLDPDDSPEFLGEVQMNVHRGGDSGEVAVVGVRGLPGTSASVELAAENGTVYQTHLRALGTRGEASFCLEGPSSGPLICRVLDPQGSVLGEVEVNPGCGWLPLGTPGGQTVGDILFSLSYLPTAERLTVVVVKARNLRWSDDKDTADPFVKVYLLQREKKVSKKKTSVRRDERNPVFNEAMIFSVPASSLQDIQLRLTVAEHEDQGHGRPMGHVFVGSQCSGKSLSHWTQMMSCPRRPVAQWHRLRPN